MCQQGTLDSYCSGPRVTFEIYQSTPCPFHDRNFPSTVIMEDKSSTHVCQSFLQSCGSKKRLPTLKRSLLYKGLFCHPSPRLRSTFETFYCSIDLIHGPQFPLTRSMNVMVRALTNSQHMQGTFEISQAALICSSAAHNSFFLTGIWNQHTTQGFYFSGWDLIRQQTLNHIMHSLYGNTRLIIDHTSTGISGRAVVDLCSLIPQEETQIPNNLIRSPSFFWHRSFAISCSESNPLTTTPIKCIALYAKQSSRTGRRVKHLHPNGSCSFTKKPKAKIIRRIREFNNLVSCRPPPPRGAPGTPATGYEECPQFVERVKVEPIGAPSSVGYVVVPTEVGVDTANNNG